MSRPLVALVSRHLIAVVGTFLIWCAVLLLAVGCAGVRSEAPQEKQGQAEVTKQKQGRSPEATASEEARCERTRTTKVPRMSEGIYTTNDLPGCPKGGLLLGTNKADKLYGGEGDDEIRGLSAKDDIAGADGNDVIYAGPGDDVFLWDGNGDDVT
jgi:RTX calcium-binding nonapeptide repeat (4 copies)